MKRVVLRLLQAVVTLFAVLVVTFLLARLSGDPVALLLPDTASAQDIEQYRERLGLNEPLPVQFVHYVQGVVSLDFGDSVRTGRPALEAVTERLPATLRLAGLSFAFGVTLSFLGSMAIEFSRWPWLRSGILFLAVGREAIPLFVFGLGLILVFAVNLGWFPAVGSGTARSIVLPAVTLGSLTLASYLRLLRSGFSDQYERDYMRTAHAKGSSKRRIILREALPNVLLPVITVAGVNLGYLLTGSVVVEQVFGWPGVASRILQAVSQRDYPVIQAGILVLAAIFIVVNLVVDFLYARIDPRVEGAV